MPLNIVDLIALGILALGIIRGWRAGGIVMVGNIASLIAGFVATAYLFHWLSQTQFLMNWHTTHPILTIIVFIFVLGIIVRLLRLVVHLLNSLYKIISVIPLLGPANRLAGAGVGLVEALVVLALATYLIKFVILSSVLWTWPLQEMFMDSKIFALLEISVDRLQFLLPQLAIWV